MTESSITWRQALLVFVGGAAGTVLRALLMQATAGTSWETWAVPAVNLVGGFMLGVLTGALEARAATRATRAARLLLGTGVLGGFTTYSALAVGALGAWTFVALAGATAVLGVGAAWLGLRAGRTITGGGGAG